MNTHQKTSDPFTWGKSIKKGPITFTSATYDGEPIKILIEDCRVLFTPNVYKGDGSETRLNVCLKESGVFRDISLYCDILYYSKPPMVVILLGH